MTEARALPRHWVLAALPALTACSSSSSDADTSTEFDSLFTSAPFASADTGRDASSENILCGWTIAEVPSTVLAVQAISSDDISGLDGLAEATPTDRGLEYSDEFGTLLLVGNRALAVTAETGSGLLPNAFDGGAMSSVFDSLLAAADDNVPQLLDGD